MSDRADLFVDYARRYSELGWALIRADGKGPRGKAWQKTRPELPDLAAGKWSRWGETLNIGVVCGTSGLAVVDVDIDPPLDPVEELKRLLRLDELPRTPIVRTGRGRLQAYFADPGGLAKHTRDGFELRVGAHQCIAPPSVHPDTGKAYRWLIGLEPWTVPLAPLPTDLVEWFGAADNGAKPRQVAETIGPGSRHEALFSIAGTLRRRGLGETEILATLRAVNAERCRPPHDDEKLTELARDVVERYAPDPVENIGATSSRDLVPTSSRVDLVPRPDSLGGTRTNDPVPDLVPEVSSWSSVNIVALAADPPEPPQIIDLFYPGLNHLVSGESEALKTWKLLAAAACELNAGFGVFWADGDDVGPGALLERLQLLGADGAAIAERFAYVRPDGPLVTDKPFDDSHRRGVLDLVRAHRIRLAVFDGVNPLMALHGLDPNVGVDVEAFYRLMDPIRKAGAANVFTDNVVKSREARGGWAIGSERKRSKADVHLEMKNLAKLVRGGAGRAKIIVQKDRPGHLTRPSPGVLVIESGAVFTWRIQPDDSRSEEGEFRPTELMTKVSRFLERREEEPQSRNQIEEARLGKAEYVRKAIDVLIEEGFAEEFDGPRKARLVQLKRPFSDEEGE